MSRSRKKNNYVKDSGTTPEIRRLTRHRLKSPKYQDTKYNFVVDSWSFNDHVYREFEFERGTLEIHERYDKERQRIISGRHPLCIRFGKENAMLKIDRRERQELFQYRKWLRKK